MDELLKTYLFKDDVKDEGIIPYLSHRDFKGLLCEERSFRNSVGLRVAYFFYVYQNYRTDKLILFLHGVGPGHKAYIREIECLCKRGYRVLTLDYSGCGKSEGDGFSSLFSPTRDVLELLNNLQPEEEITVVGHSLGGFTGLNVMNLTEIKKAVIISGFLSLSWYMSALGRKEELTVYERNAMPNLCDTDNVRYLHETEDDILLIHSKDDPIVPFDVSIGYILREIDNPHLSFHIETSRKHNPNYTDGALRYMNAVFSEYQRLVSDGTLRTYEQKKAFMSDKSAMEMTHQDEKIMQEIVNLIEK